MSVVCTVAPGREWTRTELSEDGLSLTTKIYREGETVEDVPDDEAVFVFELGVILLDGPAPETPVTHEEFN